MKKNRTGLIRQIQLTKTKLQPFSTPVNRKFNPLNTCKRKTPNRKETEEKLDQPVALFPFVLKEAM